MSNPVLELHRAAQFNALMKMKTFSTCWPTWKQQIDKLTQNGTDPAAIFDLGSKLSEIFRSTGTGRNQSTQSGGGAAWEGLVCWYLNYVLAGTNAIAIKQNKGLIPPIVLDATTVKYGNEKTNTESDLVVIILPNDAILSGSGNAANILDSFIRKNLTDCELRIVQYKTNWNDNAQIPMLWDMVYQGKYSGNASVVLGTGGVSIHKFKSFKYCFVTVPTGKRDFKLSNVAVKRLSGMTGGNYWGQAHMPGVASALSDIFTDNFANVFPGSVQQSIQSAIGGKLLSNLA